MIHGRTQSVGEAVTIERASLRPLAAERFDLQEVSFPKVDGAGCVRVKTNPYSVPAPVGTCVEAKLGSAHVELWADGQCLARHERSYVRFEPVLDLEHYLDVLERKPGALAGSTPLAQCRARGLWPASYDTLWAHLIEPARETGRDAPDDRGVATGADLRGGAPCSARSRRALTLGLQRPGGRPASAAARRRSSGRRSRRCRSGAALAHYDRPLPSVAAYDTLLSSEVGR